MKGIGLGWTAPTLVISGALLVCLVLRFLISMAQASDFNRFPANIPTNDCIFWFTFDERPERNPPYPPPEEPAVSPKEYANYFHCALGSGFLLTTTNAGQGYSTYSGRSGSSATLSPALKLDDDSLFSFCLSYWPEPTDKRNRTNAVFTLLTFTLRVENDYHVIYTNEFGATVIPPIVSNVYSYSLMQADRMGGSTNHVTVRMNEPNVLKPTWIHFALLRQSASEASVFFGTNVFQISPLPVHSAESGMGIGTTELPFLGRLDNLILLRRPITGTEWDNLQQPYPWRLRLVLGTTPYGRAATVRLETGQPYRNFHLYRLSPSVTSLPTEVRGEIFGILTPSYSNDGLLFMDSQRDSAFYYGVLMEGLGWPFAPYN